MPPSESRPLHLSRQNQYPIPGSLSSSKARPRDREVGSYRLGPGFETDRNAPCAERSSRVKFRHDLARSDGTGWRVLHLGQAAPDGHNCLNDTI